MNGQVERTPPTTLDELNEAVARGDYKPVIETFKDANRWIWDKWTCPHCGAGVARPFERASVEAAASHHLQRHRYGTERHIRQQSELEPYNSVPGQRAWHDADGNLHVEATYEAPPREPGRLATWRKNWKRR